MEMVAVGRSNTVPRQANHSNNWSSSSYRGRPPKPHHSTSTTSLMPRPIKDTNIYTGDFSVYRTQSKPELEKYQVLDGEALNAAIAGSSDLCHPSVESLTHGGQEGGIGIGLQFSLMSIKTLEDQISRLTNHFTLTYHQANLTQSPSSSVKTQVQSLLDNARLYVARSTANLERVSDLLGVGHLASAGEPPSSARSTPIREGERGFHRRTSTGRFSRSSSQGGGAIPMSRQSSGHSIKGATKFVMPNPLSSSVGIDARKQLTFDQCKLCLSLDQLKPA